MKTAIPSPLRNASILLVALAIVVARVAAGFAAAPAPAPPSSVEPLLQSAEAAVQAKDLRKAAELIRSAKQAAARMPPELDRAVYAEAALEVYRGDLEKAAGILVGYLPTVIERRNDPWALWFHNILLMLRTAQGDLTAALVECDAMRDAGERGAWNDPELDRMTQVHLKEYWHRAYLLRMLAEQSSGSRRQAALAEAEQARRAYETLAKPLGKFADSIAVLEAFFALHDRRLPAARAAARRVDVSKNDDIEDLYLVEIALDASGDHEGAAAVRRRIEAVTYFSHAQPIIRTWLARDAEASKGKRARWTPRHPTGTP